MLQSMTGFGKSSIQLAQRKINIEIKSLNSKNLDINARIALIFKEKELEIRKKIGDLLQRGKIDFTLSIENTTDKTSSIINTAVVRSYIAQLQNVVDGDPTELLKMAVRMPDALIPPVEEISEEEFQIIAKVIKEAIFQLQEYRQKEGKILHNELELRIQNIRQLLEKIEQIDPERLKTIRERLDKSITEIRDKVDENRFEQELIFYLEKLDITEEKVRLANHLNYFTETLNDSVSNGRKLGFISQEIGREINTLGSKANHAPMQQIVVQMKDELEKIKEQILNIL
ncbi:YicC/YloC family endoribonuclease [Capnocytophaga catalasegens]|uniref:YicC family protein n=1 Tax=Capnocytophaga catalasegens TaxID=1004260 RepID=A0AAV5B0K3_9FLAO|nr:YicC/YloC family endoribonuclease [Capnocytophaga catalasegens]GIZ14385.1 hypothetical protein RCZ03_03860 [Capnocytophaga catalasegens]GJM51505.1 hypothetical protein RCZ15_24780 [Capnocytophaga catalasegens]GJM53409.1 hypothetical protein RCZ16_17260 [Capnocytophaga catalasegens]